MRIILAHKFHRYTGGADVFYLEVGRVLEENGHDVAYFSTIHESNLDTEYSEYFIDPPNFKSRNPITKVFSFAMIPYNFEAKKSFQRLIKDFKPDLIHAFGIATHISPSIFDVARKNNIPVVLSMNDYKHICPNYKLFHHGRICQDCKSNKFFKAIQNNCFQDSRAYSVAGAIESYIHHWLNLYKKNVDLFLFASDFMANKTEEFWGEGAFNWSKLLNPFKIPKRLPSSNRGDYGLYFGRIVEEKGVHLIIESLKSNRQIPFKIVGDGPDIFKLKEIVSKENLTNIEFLGALWGSNLDDILYSAKFVVVPSIWHENFPYVILQAFAAGVPVIGSNRGGIPELLGNGRGITFEPNDINSLSSAMENIIANSEDSKCIGLKGREFLLDTFTDERFYNSIIANYNMVLK